MSWISTNKKHIFLEKITSHYFAPLLGYFAQIEKVVVAQSMVHLYKESY